MPATAAPRAPLRPRVTPRRAARSVAAFFLFLFLGSFAGTLLVDRCPLEWRAPGTAEILAVARGMPRRPDVVAFGSWRFVSGIDPWRVSARLAEAGLREPLVLIASLPAADPFAFDALLARLEAEGRAPRLALVEMSPESVAAASRWLAGSIQRFLTWRDVPKLRPTDVVQARAVYSLAGTRLIPWYRHRSELLAWLGHEAGLDRLGGEVPQTQRIQATGDPGALSLAGGKWVHKWLRGYEPGGIYEEVLGRFLDRARRAETGVLLVGVPVSSPYRTAYTPQVEEAYQRFLDRVARSRGVSYVEDRDLLPDGEFTDSHHAGPAGRVRFSDHVALELAARLLAPEPPVPGGPR